MRIEPRIDGDDTAANDASIYCKNGQRVLGHAYTSWGSYTSRVNCPAGKAIVGIQTIVERAIDGDDTALNGIKMECADLI